MTAAQSSRATRVLIVTVCLVGMGCALVGSIKTIRTRGLGGAVARINGVAITRAEFEQAAERVGAHDRAQRAALLQHLIDEELLLQRAVELDLLHDDPTLRKRLVAAAIDATRPRARPISTDASTRQQEAAFDALLTHLRKTTPVIESPVAGATDPAASR